MTTNKTVADLLEILAIAQDHLTQYRAYSESMRAIGRGCGISSAYQPETLAVMIDRALNSPKLPPTLKQRIAKSVDTSTMTDAQMYAHFKKTGLTEDLAFFLSLPKSDALRTRAEAIEKPTKEAIASLRMAWRAERCTYERAHQIPALGSPAWFDQNDIREMSEAEAA